MRWPFGRKDTGPVSGSAMAPGGLPAPPVPEVPAVSAPEPRPVAREWALLPPLPVTVALSAPLVVGPAPVLPPLPGPRPVAGQPITPLAGRVEGMATVLRPRPAPPVSSTVEGSAEPVPVAPPIVHRPAKPLPVDVPALTEAVDEYVGEPREPAEPYRAPGWLRYTPSWLQQGTPDLAADLSALAGLASATPGPGPALITPPSFIPRDVQSPAPPESAAPAQLPPPVQEVTPAPGAEQPPTVLKRRRPNLGESRRLGLGAPSSRPAGEPFVLPQQELVLPPPAEPPEPIAVESTVDDLTPEPRSAAGEPPPAAPEPARPAQVTPATEATPATPAPPGGTGSSAAPRVVAPTYRSPGRTRATPARKPLQRAVVVTKPPADLVDAVRATQQADVSGVPVYRGPRVGAEARARGARAFASGGAVFLPDEAGPTDSQAARGLLAHELVHAVQQRTLGPTLPAAQSPAGEALEAEAVAAEKFYGGEAGASRPAPLIHAPGPAAAPTEPTESWSTSSPSTVDPVSTVGSAQLAAIAPPSPTAPSGSPSGLHSPFDEPTREAVGQIAETSARKVVEQWSNPALGGQGFTRPGQSGQGAGGQGTGSQGTGGQGSGGQRPGGTGGSPRPSGSGVTTGVVASTLARREQMEQDRLSQLNQERIERGESELYELPDSERESIDRLFDSTETDSGSGTGGQTDARPLSTGQRWMQGLTGQTEHDGNMSFSGLSAQPGTDGSWFASRVDAQDRTPDHIAADIGIGSHDMQSSLDPHNWFDGSGDAQSTPAVADAGASGPGHTQSTAQTRAHGRQSQEDHPFNLDQIDMDELSQRLYDRLRSKMRLELLVDRERSGRLTDFR